MKMKCLLCLLPRVLALIFAVMSAAAATHQVEIRNFAFSPTPLTIKTGDTVTWTERDGAGHPCEVPELIATRP